jgi:hypothetical protein
VIHVQRGEAGPQQSKFLQSREGTPRVLRHAGANLICGLVHRHRHPGIKLIGDAPHAHERRIAEFAHRTWRKIKTHPRIRLVAIPQRLGLGEMCRRVLGPKVARIGDRQPDGRAHAGARRRSRSFLGKKICVGKRGDPGPQHFGDGELRSVPHQVGADAALFGGTDDIAHPLHLRSPHR